MRRNLHGSAADWEPPLGPGVEPPLAATSREGGGATSGSTFDQKAREAGHGRRRPRGDGRAFAGRHHPRGDNRLLTCRCRRWICRDANSRKSRGLGGCRSCWCMLPWLRPTRGRIEAAWKAPLPCLVTDALALVACLARVGLAGLLGAPA